MLSGLATPVQKCTKLTQLGLSSNSFKGAVPATQVRMPCMQREDSPRAAANQHAFASGVRIVQLSEPLSTSHWREGPDPPFPAMDCCTAGVAAARDAVGWEQRL